MKRRAILSFVLCLLLCAGAMTMLTSCANVPVPGPVRLIISSVSGGKRKAASHRKFKRAVKNQGYIDYSVFDKMVETDDYIDPVLAVKSILKITNGFCSPFDYDWYYDLGYGTEELGELIRQRSEYTSYEIYDIVLFGPEIDCDQTAMLEFFTFENEDDATRFAKLSIEQVQFPSDAVKNEINEENYSRYTLEIEGVVAVAARIGKTVMVYDGFTDSPAYKVLDNLGYN